MTEEQPLVCRDLTRDYGSVIGIEGLDLALQQGEILGLIGPNGAGKSTCLRLAVGLIEPTSGSVSLFGRPSRRATSVRHRLGYMPSEPALYRERSARSNLDLLARLSGLQPRQCAARRSVLADRLGLSNLDLDRRVGEMSHGMRQKVGLIQTLEHDPDLIILDEPSDGLDPIARDVLGQLLSEARGRGATVLLASHVLSEVEQLADRMAILHRGRLVALETRSSLRSREAYRVDVAFAGPPPSFADLAGVAIVSREHGRIQLRARPPLDALVKVLAQARVTTLTIVEPNLEDLVWSVAHRGASTSRTIGADVCAP